MKKSIFVVAAALVCSAVGSAATVSCTVNQDTTGQEGGASVACGGASAGGGSNFISAVTLIVKGTFNDSATNPVYSGQVSFTFSEQSSQLTIAPIAGNAPTSGTADTGSTGTLTGGQSGLNLASLTAFNVNVVEALLAGGRFPTSSNVTVSYDYTVSTPTPPPSDTPEPTTFAMIGVGLSALAFARRRA